MASDDESSASDIDEFSDEISDFSDEDDLIDADDIPDDDLSDEETRTESIVSRDGSEWFEKEFRRRQSRNCDVMTKSPGLTAFSEDIRTKKDAFSLFIDDDIFSIIEKHTNIHGLAKHGFDWENVSRDEFDAFNGLLLTMGFQKDTHKPLDKLWTESGPFRCSVYSGTMSRTRFKQILSCLRFDERTTRLARKSKDKLAAIREVTDLMTRNCQRSYIVSENVCIDERLAGFRGNCRFRTYLPSKPSKYGLKIWILADCLNFYIKNFQIYTGKNGSTREVDLGARVVRDLVAPLDKGRNCTMDNLFTSAKLALELLKTKMMTITGTMRKSRIEIPSMMLPDKNRKVFSSKFLFTKELAMVSYVPKKNKSVILLSSFHHKIDVDETEQKKPEIIKFYNRTKCAVDILDKICSDNDCKRGTRRWTLRLYFDYLNFSAHNSMIVYNEKHKIENSVRLRFLEELSLELVEHNVRRRATSNHLHDNVKRDIESVLKYINPVERLESFCGPRGSSEKDSRCKNCPSSKQRKTRQRCDSCHSFVCKHCLKYVCPECSQ